MPSVRISAVVDRRRPVVLVVEDDRYMARAIERHVPKEIDARFARTVAAASSVLAKKCRLVAAIVDVGLPDGSGLEVVRQIRERHSSVPVLVLTAQVSAQLANEVNMLGAQYVCKPDFVHNLDSFFRSLAPEHSDAVRAATRASAEMSLTQREHEVLLASLNGVPRGRLAEVLRISENTVKKHVRSLLKKTGQGSLPEAVWYACQLGAGPEAARRSSSG